MDNQNTEAHDLIVKAREALRRGDKETAHTLAEQAALLAPGMEEAWLVLTASDPNPEDALAYAQQALEINPSSERALKAVEWAIARLKQAQTVPEVAAGDMVAPVPTEPEKLEPAQKPANRTWLYVAGALALLLCAVFAFMAYQGVRQLNFASIVNSSGLNKVTEPTQENHWAPMSLPKPASAPSNNGGSSPQTADTPAVAPTLEPGTSGPTELPASASTAAVMPTFTPGGALNEGVTATSQASDSSQASSGTQTSDSAQASSGSQASTGSQASDASQTSNGSQASSGSQASDLSRASDGSQASTGSQTSNASAAAAQQAAETPAVMSMEMVPDAPVGQPASPSSPSSSAPLPAAATDGSGARWIDVDLTNQMVYAYVGDTVVNSFLVSTGTWLHPTVVGQYNVYVKYRSAPMSGPGYYLPNVPYIMYFYGDYGLHGTYWHNNFGTPMSHGCVNLRTDEAAWLYNWASVGTLVNIHY